MLVPIDFGSASNCDTISLVANIIYLSPILNPLLYSMMGSRFRKTLKESLVFRESIEAQKPHDYACSLNIACQN